MQPGRTHSVGRGEGSRCEAGPKEKAATPVCDKMKAAGQWNTGWDGFFEIDPVWTGAIIAASLPVYTSGILSPNLRSS